MVQWVCRHHNEQNQGLGLKNCCFQGQVVLGLSIVVSVFPYIAYPEVVTGKPASVGCFYPHIQGGLTNSSARFLCRLLCCPLLMCYGYQGSTGSPIL
jgi:hypothetical protein